VIEDRRYVSESVHIEVLAVSPISDHLYDVRIKHGLRPKDDTHPCVVRQYKGHVSFLCLLVVANFDIKTLKDLKAWSSCGSPKYERCTDRNQSHYLHVFFSI
jgi:hypothetical protein